MGEGVAQAKNYAEKLHLETLTAIKRAGANIIISYHAEEVMKWIA